MVRGDLKTVQVEVMCVGVCRLEGPRCDVDINECVRGTDNCASNAACINTQGMHTCFPPYCLKQTI